MMSSWTQEKARAPRWLPRTLSVPRGDITLSPFALLVGLQEHNCSQSLALGACYLRWRRPSSLPYKPLLLSLELTSLELVFSYSSLLKFSLSSAFCTLHYYWNLLSWIFFNIFLTTLYVKLMTGIFFFRIESQYFGQTIHNVGREVAALPRCAVNYKLWTVSKWPASLEMCGPPSRDRYTCFARPACGSCCCRMW